MQTIGVQDINRFWNKIWKEAREDSFSVGLGNTSASASLVGYIPANAFALAVGCILGYSTVVNGNMLWRLPPASHPRVRNLYASSVKISPFAFQVAGKPMTPLNMHEVSPAIKSTISNPYIPVESYNIPPKAAAYEVLKVEIDFSEFVGVSFASNLQSDFGSTYYNREYLRYTSVTFEPSVEVLQMDSMANLVFKTGPQRGQAFPTPVGILLPQAKLKLKWMWVPHAFLADQPMGKIPFRRKIQEKLGHVNSKQFLFFPPGTLLFTGYSTEPIVTPLPDLASNSVIMQLSWNVEFEFTILETVAAQWANDLLEWQNRGHNVFPCRADRRFYPATVAMVGQQGQNQTNTTPLYDGTDFSTIFTTTK